MWQAKCCESCLCVSSTYDIGLWLGDDSITYLAIWLEVFSELKSFFPE